MNFRTYLNEKSSTQKHQDFADGIKSHLESGVPWEDLILNAKDYPPHDKFSGWSAKALVSLFPFDKEFIKALENVYKKNPKNKDVAKAYTEYKNN